MEIYKGIATFSGIAIGKILYYSRGEYQIRQCLVSNIKKEIEDFRKAKEQAVAKLKELYEANKSLNEQEARTFLNQAKLLESRKLPECDREQHCQRKGQCCLCSYDKP